MAPVNSRLQACVTAILLFLFTSCSAQNTLSSWATCGGSQFCPCGTNNCDAQWPGNTCIEGESCTRHDPTWWRCEPRGSVCWAKTVDTWAACGGTSNCPYGTSTCDAPWQGHCCRHGDVCARKDASWWRCEPSNLYYDNNVCWGFAGTWMPCSTADKVCCSKPGDSCVYKNSQWSRCEPSNAQSQASPPPPRGVPPQPLKISGNRIVRQDTGETVILKGLNWFGFNVARTMVDGLGHGGSNAETDFATIVYELKLLGFNLVRLPFRYRDLDQPIPKDYSVKCWDISQEDLRRRLMSPGTWTNKGLPSNPATVPRYNGYCNGYLPSVSTYNRLMYTIQAFISQGMYVVLDYQPMNTEPQANNIKEFVCKWRNLMSRVLALDNFNEDIRDRIFVDIMNEPDSMSMGWEPSNGKIGARDLYLSTMDSLHALSSSGWLYIVEGAGQNNFGLNWGNGFITDTSIIARYGLSNANRFFDTLLDKPYADKVVISPHVYPPSITKATFLGDTLWQQSAVAFGYLQTKGYCNSRGKCRVFPVVVGETGSFMTDGKDKQWLNDFADFIQAKGGARSYNSMPIAGWMWWCYNQNSGDTGGIVYDNWSKLDWTKLNFLIDRLSLNPWYKW